MRPFLKNSEQFKEIGLYFFVCVIGISIFFRELYQSGFDGMIGDLGDSRFNLVVMEHWVKFFQGEADWLSPEYFFPVKGTLGYSDSLFLYAIPHFFLRTAGFDQFTAYQILLVSLSIIGFIGMICFLRRGLRLKPFASAIGAYLAVFNNGMYVSSANTQLFSIYFIPALSMALISYLRSDNQYARIGYGTFFVVFLNLLLYTSYYTAWFYIFFLLILATLYGLVNLSVRRMDFIYFMQMQIKKHGGEIAGLFAIFFLCLIPFLRTYLPIIPQVGLRSFDEVFTMLPSLFDFMNTGKENFLWGNVLSSFYSRLGNRPMAYELQKGIPLLTFIVFLGSVSYSMKLIKIRQGRLGQCKNQNNICLAVLLSLSVLVIWVLMVKFGKFSLWYNVYHLVPGAQAIRAVFRFQLLLLLVMNTVIAIALNDIVDHLPYKRWINNRSKAFIHGILGLLCVFLMMEQVNHANILNYSKQQNIVMLQQIDPPPAHCKVFFVDYKTVPYRFPAFPVITAQMDAMLIAMHFHIPTLNGYSGFFPSGWWVEAQDVDASLKRWINKNNIDITTVYALNPADGKWTPCQEYLKTKRNYRLGDPISFGANGNAYFFTRKGWSNAEESFTWTEGPSAYIAIDIPPQPDNITLEMDLIPYTPDNHKQIIEVYVNKEKCGNWTALKEGIYSVAIPGHLTKTGLLSIEFVIPACISPKDAGQSNDARDLGMAVKSLRIY